jgi:hypothetical protein
MRNAAAFISLALLTGAAPAQQQAPTPIPQNVVVPSLPDQPNKEGVVNPSGSMKSDDAGYVRNNARPVDPGAPATAAGASGVAPGPGIMVPASPAPAAAPHGPAVVRAAHLTIRGAVKAYEKGVSITIVDANGKTRMVPLAAKAVVYESLAVGDKVVLDVPLQKPGDGKHANRVEKQKPAKAPAASKFSQAESPKS